MKKLFFRGLGALGTIVCIGIFVRAPSFPTPDKLLVFLTCVFMAVGQAQAMLQRLGPFVWLLLVYESFRGLAPHLNQRVEYVWMIHADTVMGMSHLPTLTLQHWLWHGAVRWYDFAFYLAYMLHFVLPLSLAILIWKSRSKHYWQYVSSFVVLSFAGFITFILFPAAPPWMAAEKGFIPRIERISSHVWHALGIHDFPSLYNQISPNPVAAVPSLHAGYATLLFLFVLKLFGKRAALAASIYPLLIYIGTVYQGEHYVIDELLGILYAVAAYYAVQWLFERFHIQDKFIHYYRRQMELWRTGTGGRVS